MTFQSAPDCSEIIINATYSGKVIANVLNAFWPSGYSQADLNILAEAVDGVVGSLGLPLFCTGVEYTGVLVRGLTDAVDLQATNNDSADAGTATGDNTPPNVSFCITLRTGLTGRSARGRLFMFPMGSDNLLDQNTVATGYRTDAEDYVSALLAAIVAAGAQPVVLSRFSGGVARVEAVHFTITNAVARNALIDSQRNRMVQGH